MRPHPRIPKTITWGSEAANWIVGSVVLSSTLGALAVWAELWASKGLADYAVFLASGPMFAVYVTGFLIAGGVDRRGVLVPMFLYGALFPIWCLVLMPLLGYVGGMGGVPQAVITALVLRKATKSWIPGIGALVGLGVGWGIVVMCRNVQFSPWGLLTFPWHATVVAALVVWVVRVGRKQEIETRADRGLCPKCNYDLAGLGGGAAGVGVKCPECGAIPKSA